MEVVGWVGRGGAGLERGWSGGCWGNGGASGENVFLCSEVGGGQGADKLSG